MPERLTALPPPMLFELGREPDGDVCAALLLVTTDEDGAPRTAVLSPGEVHAPDARRLTLRVYATSGTAANLRAGRTALLWYVLDGAAYSIRGTPSAVTSDDAEHARFEIAVAEVLRDFSAQAPMVTGPTYRRL